MQPKVWQLSAAPEGHSHPVPCSSHQDNKGGKEGAGSVKSTGDKLGLRTRQGSSREIVLVHCSIPRRTWQHKRWETPAEHPQLPGQRHPWSLTAQEEKGDRKKKIKNYCLKKQQSDPQQCRGGSRGWIPEGRTPHSSLQKPKSSLPGSGIQAQ